MSDFLSLGLNQRVTHWELTGVDGYNKPTFAAPVQYNGRWEERTEKIQNDEGEEVVSRARIFLENDVKANDYLMLGESASGDPLHTLGAHKVLAYRKIPSLDGVFFERKAFL